VFCHISAGGAGNGDPLERDAASVAQDVRLELLTPEYAAAVYGVLIDQSGDVDTVATAERRAELRIERSRTVTPDTSYLAEFLAPLRLTEPVLTGERLFSCRAVAE
jgi:N-methylhydantoinase B